VAAGAPLPGRAVSFWYSPSAADVNQTIAVLSDNRNAVTSVMLYCGHEVNNDGKVVGSVSELCDDGKGGGLVPQLKGLGIGVEFVLNDGCGNVTAHKVMFADQGVPAQLATIGKAYGLYGWNLDLEPHSSAAGDASAYAAFCTQLRTMLRAAGMRLTIDVAQWSPMLSQYALLAPTVDRMMDMETYNADSMDEWLAGGSAGGYYTAFVNAQVPRAANGVGLGCWPAMCGDHLCWSAGEASVAPRMQRIAADGVPEVALFRLAGANTAQPWPAPFWWPALAAFLRGAL